MEEAGGGSSLYSVDVLGMLSEPSWKAHPRAFSFEGMH